MRYTKGAFLVTGKDIMARTFALELPPFNRTQGYCD
jgi:hypothetical protein